jgi:Fe-S cluster assembly ATP-binding protein
MVDDVLLQVEDVWVQRPGIAVLRGVDLRVSQGEIHALLGLNGSGKTSLAHTLMGASGYEVSRGRIDFDGVDLSKLDVTDRARRGITLAWQEPARFEGLATGDYLALGMRAPSLESVKEALKAVSLEPARYLARPVDESLSGGERKRIELAAVYAMRPRLAILDEPDSGIDVICVPDVVALIRRMADQGTAVLVITHRKEVVDIAHRASLICAGVIVRTGTPAEVSDYFLHRCRPHADLLGDQPWGPEAGGTYRRVLERRTCDD